MAPEHGRGTFIRNRHRRSGTELSLKQWLAADGANVVDGAILDEWRLRKKAAKRR